MSLRDKKESESFDTHGNAHATANAESGDTFMEIGVLQFVEKCYKDSCARAANRMTESYCTAVYVYNGRV